MSITNSNICQHQLSTRVKLTGLPPNTYLPSLEFLMSAYGTVSEIELHQVLDERGQVECICEVDFEEPKSASYAAKSSWVIYRENKIDIELVEESTSSHGADHFVDSLADSAFSDGETTSSNARTENDSPNNFWAPEFRPQDELTTSSFSEMIGTSKNQFRDCLVNHSRKTGGGFRFNRIEGQFSRF